MEEITIHPGRHARLRKQLRIALMREEHLRGQLRRANLLINRLQEQTPTGVPAVEDISNALMQLTKIPWNQPRKLRELRILLGLVGLGRYLQKYLPDPNAEIRALRFYLTRVVGSLAVDDRKASKEQADIVASEPRLSKAAALLLGLTHATANARVGTRRTLAARELGRDPETIRRWYARTLCDVVAAELVRREGDRIRDRLLQKPAFDVNEAEKYYSPASLAKKLLRGPV